VEAALEAAGELRVVSLGDALELCLLLARARDPRYSRAAQRWLARFTAESGSDLNDSLIAGAALSKLEREPNSDLARDTLEQLLETPT
jgi:hypothetical protein